jgi:ParB-like chromosome segregation protein Spo0J
MVNEINMNGEDVDIEKLVPLKERDINLRKNRGYKKILSSINTVGLIEPLCAYRENGHYVILDGFLRYKALQQLGAKTIPCLIYPTKKAYTFNRMVNKKSAVQESRMLRESLKKIDHSTIAEVFSLKSLQYRLGTDMLKHLDQKIISSIDKGLMSRRCARELTYVKLPRQVEILKEMEKTGDFSISFARAMVIKTPARMRNKNKKDKRPWQDNSERKQELVSKLEAVQKRYDFYTNLYRQYSADLLKVYIYVRKLITNNKARTFLDINHPEVLERFEKIIFETKEK